MAEKEATVKLLTKAEILGADDYREEDVYVEVWGGTVRVKSLSGKERDRFERSITDMTGKNAKTKDNVRATLVALACIDETGARLFTTEDVKMLGAKSAAALDAVYDVASRLSKVSDRDVEELTEDLD